MLEINHPWTCKAFQHLRNHVSIVQIWLVRNPKCLPGRAANAEPLQDGQGATPLQAAIVRGESLVAQLSRKFLRDAGALLAAV